MITNSTFSGNSASSGGGIYNFDGGGSATVTIGDTILKTGASGENIYSDGIVTSLGYNLSNDDGGGFLTGMGDRINTDPMLGPLQDNGGPTFTHALLTGSPAIDAGKRTLRPEPQTSAGPVLFARSITLQLQMRTVATARTSAHSKCR